MKEITKETNIMEAMEINPNAFEILLDAGLGCVGCSMSVVETIEQGLSAHGMGKEEINEVVEELNKNYEE